MTKKMRIGMSQRNALTAADAAHEMESSRTRAAGVRGQPTLRQLKEIHGVMTEVLKLLRELARTSRDSTDNRLM
jgi:hypothetical protein